MKKATPRPSSPLFLALLAALLFGAATPLSKILLQDLGPFQLAGLLYLGAALGVAPVALRPSSSPGRAGLPRRGDRTTQLRLLGAVLFGGVLGPVALLFALRLAEASSVALWLNLELAATAMLGVVLFREHLGRRGLAGVVLALTAASVLSVSTGLAGVGAASLVALACLCWGLDNHLTALIDGITPSQSTMWKGLIAGSVNLALGLLLRPMGFEPELSVGLLAGSLALGALSYGASIVLYIMAAQRLGAIRSQVVFSTAPLFGVGLAVVLLGESLTALHLLAAMLFLMAIALLISESHHHLHEHEPMSHQHWHRHDDGHHDHAHPGLRPWVWHSHRHEHEPLAHSHAHMPDLHHRHRHHRPTPGG